MREDQHALAELISELPTEEKIEIFHWLTGHLVLNLPLTELHAEPSSGEAEAQPSNGTEVLDLPCCPHCGNSKPSITEYTNEAGTFPWGASSEPGAMALCPKCRQRGVWIRRPMGSRDVLPGEPAKTAGSQPSECKHRYRRQTHSHEEGTGDDGKLKKIVLDPDTFECQDCGDAILSLPEVHLDLVAAPAV